MFKNKFNYSLFGSLDHVPQNMSYLADSPNIKFDFKQLDLKWNEEIQHIHIDNNISSVDGGSYYDDYLMTTSYSKQIQKLQKQQLDKLISIYQEKEGLPESLIEIGCGDGSFLNHAKNRIPSLLGIEPSARFSVSATKQGHKIINGYVTSSSKLTQECFDFLFQDRFLNISQILWMC